jgi:hypothetical protein
MESNGIINISNGIKYQLLKKKKKKEKNSISWVQKWSNHRGLVCALHLFF